MRSLVQWVLGVLFPPRLDAKLTHEELHLTLDFYRRDSRRKPFVWSSVSNSMEHPAKPKPTIQEWRSRDLSQDNSVLSVGNRVFITRLR